MNETPHSNRLAIDDNSLSAISYHHEKISNKLMTTVPPRLMPETVEDILNTFTFFDLNANQCIEVNELKRILNALNFKKTTDECYEIINTYDLNNDQMIDFHEFIFALARLIKHDVFTLLDIQQRFTKFDEDQDGKITISTLPILLRKGFGIPVNDYEIFDLLAKFDIVNESTKISFEKFIRMLQFAVRQGEKSHVPEYMKKLKHRCGPALRNIHHNDIKLLKKRMGGYLSSSMDEMKQ
ncbi:unnamed protein product [Rotaria socialis]|uniref:EF-hand domain-containing protein n=2 Tax=Rotaria socialis TaxID=392032 RepID=A0A817SPI1_9BILA|nr:unnamed protein product [Rotaria socialis]CAF3468713.1 unnamed protein product [Rotaria socialis]CAF4244650.1 unnamed protein product [Rotaria socialis]CAF4421078.1 unnamed protein product [Rotaria socialis]CAF4467814.1 unnamed protein product [Rotaria socialis]